jgi:GDP-L-fucose synthase
MSHYLNHKVFVTGHTGMVGSAILKLLKNSGYKNILTAERTSLDLTRQERVEDFFRTERPDVVINCAAKVGGIHANNTYGANFIYENLQIQSNIIHTAHKYDVEKLVFLGSSCIYPKFCDQPIREEYLLTSPLEQTNEAYALAKIAGIKMCENYYRQFGRNFISVMPTNQYGPNDNYHPENSHVMAALLKRFFDATKNDKNEVKVWGTGKAKREFMYVDDLAAACLFILNNVNADDLYGQGVSQINIGTGEDISIKDLSEKIAEKIGFTGKISFELDKPDGTLRKLLDVSRLKKFGWTHSTSLDDGLGLTIKDIKDGYNYLTER